MVRPLPLLASLALQCTNLYTTAASHCLSGYWARLDAVEFAHRRMGGRGAGMNVLVAAGDAVLQREVVEGLNRTGFGVAEVGRPGLISSWPDDTPLASGALHAAVVGHGFGFDALAFGALMRKRHPCLGVVYLVGDPWMPGRTRALDHRCERTVLRPSPGQRLCMVLLARVLGQIAGSAQ